MAPELCRKNELSADIRSYQPGHAEFSASKIQSAHAGVGFGLAPPGRAALARPDRASGTELPPPYDPNCYLCPGNVRTGGARNPPYSDTFVFDNDFAALQPDTPPAHVDVEARGILVAETERGVCRVVCFSPRHDLTLARLSPTEIRALIDVWVGEFERFGSTSRHQLCANLREPRADDGMQQPHPHGQIWATSTMPNEPRKEQEAFAEYQKQRGTCLLCDYIGLEEASGGRLVCGNDHFLAVVPFWAVWPYEILVVPRQHVGNMGALDEQGRSALADILKRVTSRYDDLFQVSCPYSMGFHQDRRTTRSMVNGISTRTFSRLCSGLPVSGSLWLALNCWDRRNAISRRNMRRRNCERSDCRQTI